jgi:outer membrane murein-binding lipoprotein Lpp
VGLLVVLAVVGGLYVQQGLSYLSTRAQADRQAGIAQRLQGENDQLSRQQKALSDPATIASHARALGMVRAGERSYVFTGTPSR